MVGWNESRLIKHEIGQFSVTINWMDRFLNTTWTFTTAYGPTEHNLKPIFWRELRQLRSSFPNPWIVGGDFNATYKIYERNGTPQSRKISKAFLSFIKSGIWSNHRECPILAKLVRLLISIDWDDLCPHATQSILPNPCSNHAPIKLSILGLPKVEVPFRFDRS